ncbi:MAG: hypothetical protein GC161_09515 [Planctomycetaceae bacterium]|nr:hypothetical protein [Planctomycetaceae bacterium]
MPNVPVAPCALALALLVPTTTPARADVLVVDPVGGPGSFATIQAAVDAAFDGDVILVRQGVYGGFTIDAKAVAVVAAAGTFPKTSGESRILNLPVGKSVLLSGLDMAGLTSTSPTLGRALTVADSWGAVRIQDTRMVGANNLTSPSNCLGVGDENGWPALVAERSPDVMLAHSDLIGGRGLQQASALGCPKKTPGGDGGPALTTLTARVALFQCYAQGGLGGMGGSGGHGAEALRVLSGSNWIYDSELLGGNGGAGFDWLWGPGGNGGYGATFLGGSNLNFFTDSTVLGGAGGSSFIGVPGFPGQPFLGFPQFVEHPTVDLRFAGTTVGPAPVLMTVQGPAQTLPFLLVSPVQGRFPSSPPPILLAVSDPLILGLPPVGPSGSMQVSVPTVPVPPGAGGWVLPTQVAAVTPQGELLLGTPRSLVLLAPGF